MSTNHERMQRLFSRPLPEPMTDVPDSILHDCMVSLGFPASDTFVQFKYTMPGQYRWLRGLALKVYMDTVYAARGDKEARERVDYMREMWQEMTRRKHEQQAREEHTVTL